MAAGCVALALGASGALGVRPARAAAGGSEVATVQPESPSASAKDVVVLAAASGFVHHRQGANGPQWTDYETGTSHSLPWLVGVADSAVLSGGGDAIVVVGTGSFTVHTPDDDSPRTYPVPDGFTLRGVSANGSRALITRERTSQLPAEVRLLDLTAGGSVVPITGIPDGATVVTSTVTTDGGTHAALGFRLPSAPPWYVVVDTVTGAATHVPQVYAGALTLYLTGTDLAWIQPHNGDIVVGMLPESAILDGTSDPMTPAGVTLYDTGYTLAPVGGHLLVGTPASSISPTPKMLNYPFAGGAPTTVLAYDAGVPRVAADGTVLAVGGADTTSSAVRRYAADADGAVAASTVLDLPPVTPTNGGVTLAHGYLRHIEAFPQLDGSSRFGVYNHGIAPDADPGVPFTTPSGGQLPATAVPCQDGQRCVHTVDGNGYGTSFVVPDGTGTRVQTYDQHVGYTLPTTGGRLVDASLGYQIVAGGSAATMYVVHTGAQEVVASGPDTGAALWDDTLWQAPTTATAGTVTATDLTARPPKVVRTISVGSTCRPSEMQVAQHWLYWSCGTSGPAGVYDLTTGHTVPVPAGRALLGDGYVLRHDGGQLVLTDVHDDTAAAPRVLATLPATAVTDDRSITWAVDRFGGDVAYVDADNVTHVLTTGVPASPVTADAYADTTVYPRVPGDDPSNTWHLDAAFDRPVDGWRLTIARQDNGSVVYTAAGGASREFVDLYWNGRLADGSLATSGAYRWALTATVDGATAAVGGGSGALAVECGSRPFRGYGCAGSRALLAVRTDAAHRGQADWWQGTANATLSRVPDSEETWDLGTNSWQVSALVPFGDIDGDGSGDLLARTGDGELTAYLGGSIIGSGAGGQTVRLGGGYNAYNALLSVGDVDRDGHDDLLERDTSGTMWFKGGTGKTALRARVQIATGWNTYTRLAAIGDVNGDGRGDLIAVDHNNIVWRYYGAAGGTFPHRTQIATGWNTYNRIVGVGDLSGDGRPDLITRDSAGTVWRYDATTTSTYPHRVKIATGWGTYGIY